MSTANVFCRYILALEKNALQGIEDFMRERQEAAYIDAYNSSDNAKPNFIQRLQWFWSPRNVDETTWARRYSMEEVKAKIDAHTHWFPEGWADYRIEGPMFRQHFDHALSLLKEAKTALDCGIEQINVNVSVLHQLRSLAGQD